MDKLLIKTWFGHLDKRVLISYICKMKIRDISRLSKESAHPADSSVLKKDFARAHCDVVEK